MALSLLLASPLACAATPKAPRVDPEQRLVSPAKDLPQAEEGPRAPLLDAMAAELARNQERLRLEGHEAPYYISYQLKDGRHQGVAARYGAVFEDASYRERRLGVDVRVGDYGFDSSREEEMPLFSGSGPSYVARATAPLDDDPVALRTSLWLLTDQRYKAALFNYLKKRGERVYAVEDPNRPPSFSKEAPSRHIQADEPFRFDAPRWTAAARRLSLAFNAHPEIMDSEVRVSANQEVRYLVTSEGTRIVTGGIIYGVHLNAVTRAADGQLLDNSRDFYAPNEDRLPSMAELERATRTVIEELLALRAAAAIDPYTGPAILAAPAAGVLFHEAVGHRLEGERQQGDHEGKTFVGQVGRRVLPEFLSVYDDPNLEEAGGVPLNGHYRYDDEGVRGQRANLVERGVLKGYLLSRRPVEGFPSSNGHGRAQSTLRPIARMANLIVDSSRQVSDEELKRMLIAEAKKQGKPYGLIIRDITGGNTNTSSYGYQAFKGIPRMVYRVDVADGSETLVRGVEIVGTPLSAMNRILATGKVSGVFNGYCGAESGNVPVSTVAPAMLLQEIELQRAVEGKDRPPILPSPSADSAAPL